MTFSFSIFLSKRFWIALILLIALALFLFWRSTTVQVLLETLAAPDLPDIPAPQARVALDQNWDPETAERFHFISQGTETLPIPYSWLLALEQPEKTAFGLLWPDSEPGFVTNDYLRRYGFITAEASAGNPDGLPIGFATTPFQNIPGYSATTTAVGFTCAACHTAHFTYEGTEYIVNGGPSTVDLQLLSKGIGAALGQTLLASKLPLPNRRFDRFARNVLGATYSEKGKAALAAELQTVLDVVAKTADVIEVAEGFGRLDALNRIGNQVFSKNTGRKENYQAINAPVNFPHIWTASWFDWVQYDGSIMQPLVRNAGEAMGVHASVDTIAPVDGGRFSSSVPVENLKWIEDNLAGDTPPFRSQRFEGLHGPAWPDALPPIDAALAAQGRELYGKHCSGCHLPPLDSDAIWSERYFRPIGYVENGRSTETKEAFLALNILPLKKIGTDPAQSAVLSVRTVNTAADPATGLGSIGIDAVVCTPRPRFAGPGPRSGKTQLDSRVYDRASGQDNQLVQVRVTDGPQLKFALALGAIVQQVDNRWFDNNFIPEDLRPYFEGERPNCLQAGAGYKARPLNGVWATAPFLHNGSVPTLDDLLRPADQRPAFVRLGNPEFDPIKVGLAQPSLSGDSYPSYQDGFFVLDTSLPGNRNSGHAFGASATGDRTGVIGPALSDDQRRALIEYLKTL